MSRFCQCRREPIFEQGPVLVAHEFGDLNGVEGVGGGHRNLFSSEVLYEGQQLITAGRGARRLWRVHWHRQPAAAAISLGSCPSAI